VRKTPLLLLAALGLVYVPSALAHAEATPAKVRAGSVATIVIRVEGEEPAPATKIAVQVPQELSDVKPRPTPGWKLTRSGRVITWSGGEIAQEAFGRFAFSARMPDAPAGTELTFPTVQTYANGKVVHWIGEESSDTPAPHVSLTAAKRPPPPPPPPAATTTATPEEQDDDDSSIVWLIVGIVAALVVIALALTWRRRR
jgi:uncharacterized protein YcnI